MIDKLKNICKNTSIIPVSFNNIGLFGLEVLFISPSISHELLNLQQKFDSNYPNWVAHVTMLIDNQDNIQKAIPIIANKFFTFTGYIESISLYEFFPSKFIIEEKLLTNI
ncbi:2'-5' RNA ligase [[Clostridium] sordellii]|nr:2'-5' RNA ligase [[Clostridium] sordellii] [Paeniclostridium sordellii]